MEDYVVPLHEDFEAGRPQLCEHFPTTPLENWITIIIIIIIIVVVVVVVLDDDTYY